MSLVPILTGVGGSGRRRYPYYSWKFPRNTVAPAITGTAQVTQTLTLSDGTWAGNPVPTLTKQWYANGIAIAGATGNTYVVQAGDVDKVITGVVTGTNSKGIRRATSAPTATVIA